MIELPPYGLRTYALLYRKYGSRDPFEQRELEWSMSTSMRKKVFALLLRAGWIVKVSRREYRCVSPAEAITGLLEFRVPEVLKKSQLPYALVGSSAIEIWSDYVYVQRGIERSPYFVKILKKDLHKWKNYLNRESVPNYVGAGSTVGEFVILIPITEKLNFVEKDGFKVEPLKEAMKEAGKNYLHSYALNYMKKKHGETIT